MVTPKGDMSTAFHRVSSPEIAPPGLLYHRGSPPRVLRRKEDPMTQLLRRCWRASRLPLLALAVAAAVLAHEVRRRRPPPRSVGELVDRLRASGMQLRVIAAAQSTQ